MLDSVDSSTRIISSRQTHRTLNLFRLVFSLGISVALTPLQAAPYTPTSDAQVLERLPARADAAGLRRVNELRRQLASTPQDAALAVGLAKAYYELAAAEGDPRYIGYAQAALAPWWKEPNPSPEIRVERAVILQFNHHCEEALADLRAAVHAQPGNALAWAWMAAIAMVQAQYPQAREACTRMAPHTSALVATACSAAVDAHTGRAAAATAALQTELRTTAPPAEQLWALTRLAETQERLGDAAATQSSFQRGLALALPDVYLLAAYADFLLDQGRAAEVLVLLKDKARADVLLLRLALAARATNSPQLKTWQDDLTARFAAARLRGDSTHVKEESRFVLALQGDAQRALALAAENYAVQREPADARILLEAALAAGKPEAAAPVLAWMRESKIESKALGALAQKLGARP